MLSDLRRLFAILLAVSCCLSTGEPPVPAEATNAFAAQGENATVPTVPSVVGLWIWSGRADAQYRPFFEWDLRLAAGMSALDGIKARLTTLGPDQEVLRQGGWISLDAIGAGSSRDVALRLNCPVFPAWKLELTWNGGHASWIGFDLASLPIPHSGSEDGSIVVAVGADADPIKGKKGAIATWYLWNLGNKPATQVTQIVRLRNQAGAVVATGELVMAKDEVLAAHASKPCRLVLPNAPAWQTVAVETKQPKDAGSNNLLIPPASTGPDLVVERITIDRGTLTAEVVNRLGRHLDGAVITLSFTNAGKETKDVAFTVGALADSAMASVQATAGAIPAWDAYSVGWAPAP